MTWECRYKSCICFACVEEGGLPTPLYIIISHPFMHLSPTLLCSIEQPLSECPNLLPLPTDSPVPCPETRQLYVPAVADMFRFQIKATLTAAHAIAPNARYMLRESYDSSSRLGNAVAGYVAHSANYNSKSEK
jgi:hypothetical protein